MKRLIIFCAMVVCVGQSFPQFGFNNTVSAGYNANVMNNYQHRGDQSLQNYLELNYTNDKDTVSYQFGYVGSLQMFNTLTSRNYYEHSASFNYSRVFLSKENRIKQDGGDTEDSIATETADSTNENDSTGVQDTTESADSITALNVHDTASAIVKIKESAKALKDTVCSINQKVVEVVGEFDDSTNAYFSTGAVIGARHDKNIFKEYDNQSGHIFGTWRNQLSDRMYYSVTDAAEIRSYTYLQELSNFTNNIRFQLGNTRTASNNLHFFVSVGNKIYLRDDYDTSVYTQKGTLDTASGAGKGKGGAASSSNIVAKKILVTDSNVNIWQISYGVSEGITWASGDAVLTGLQRFNLGKKSGRYLAQYANTNILTEDIYNDSFNYGGFEATLEVNQKLPLDCKLKLNGTVTSKQFRVNALNLKGIKTASERHDITSYAEAALTKTFHLSASLSCDLFLNATLLRNQSNDEYNDFSSSVINFGIGINR